MIRIKDEDRTGLFVIHVSRTCYDSFMMGTLGKRRNSKGEVLLALLLYCIVYALSRCSRIGLYSTCILKSPNRCTRCDLQKTVSHWYDKLQRRVGHALRRDTPQIAMNRVTIQCVPVETTHQKRPHDFTSPHPPNRSPPRGNLRPGLYQDGRTRHISGDR